MEKSNECNVKKSEILFLYETSYNVPNGDPFTGEQRYDDETKKILVSDVRIKRFIRTYLEDVKGLPIYVSGNSGNKDAKARIEELAKLSSSTDIKDILKEQIDVRLFGGISTLGKDGDSKKKDKILNRDSKECINGHVQFTGPVQFALLNPSLNRVDLRMHQNTSHFTSGEEKKQGAIATTTVVPYSVMQIHGWINSKVAETTGCTEEDIRLMFQALWNGTNGEGSSFSRSKVGQDSLLMLQIVYKDDASKLYGVDRLIKLKSKESDKKEEQFRSMDDFELDFDGLKKIAGDSRIDAIYYYTELEGISQELIGDNFQKMDFTAKNK